MHASASGSLRRSTPSPKQRETTLIFDTCLRQGEGCQVWDKNGLILNPILVLFQCYKYLLCNICREIDNIGESLDFSTYSSSRVFL